MNWVFDRVADIYDATRGLPPEVSEAYIDRLLDGLGAGPETRFVEIGVGTGRIARPLARRGHRVVGFDLSRPMLRQAGGVDGLDLVRADVVSLPLAGAVADVVVAVHVFHLVEQWRRALDEAWRVLKPGGCLAVGRDRRPPAGADLTAYIRRWCEARGIDLTRPGIEQEGLHEVLLGDGMRLVETERVRWTGTFRLRDRIDSIGRRVWTLTWPIPDELLTALQRDLLAWAESEPGGLETPRSATQELWWEIWRR